MLPYQEHYILNMQEIGRLGDFYPLPDPGFDAWYRDRQEKEQRIRVLRQENITILEEELFPTLDDIHRADAEQIRSLREFADALLDWSSNLDCGVYLLIHDALLSLFRIRKDRSQIIQELYKLGMGMYYRNRSVQGMEDSLKKPFYFENEMVFTEAGSYLKYFEHICEEETKGYILRSLANISIASLDMKRKVGISGRVLQILQDPYYRTLAPGLPWDAFLRKTHQQMSSCRHILTKGDMSTAELAAVLDSCSVVFEPEKDMENPNIRWLWPYYEMEYSCGFASLMTTLNRMEWLIDSLPYDQYDYSGLYANVQLPVYYGRLMEDNPFLQTKDRHVRFLSHAYRKMMKTLLSIPAEKYDDFFHYLIILVVTDYLEIEGTPSYRDILLQLIRRIDPVLYLRSLKKGQVMQLYCSELLKSDPSFFDEIPVIGTAKDLQTKKSALTDYAMQCGLLLDSGLLKIKLERLSRSRNLFEPEYQLYRLHAESGADDLRKRTSTEMYADPALGHHRWYDGSDGYPDSYVRNLSPFRTMTDTAAIAVFLCENYSPECSEEEWTALLSFIQKEGGTRFSTQAAACLDDASFTRSLREILSDEGKEHLRSLYSAFYSQNRVVE